MQHMLTSYCQKEPKQHTRVCTQSFADTAVTADTARKSFISRAETTMKQNECRSVNPAFKTYFLPNFCSFKSPEIPSMNEQELNE